MLQRIRKPNSVPMVEGISPVTWQPIFAMRPNLNDVSSEARDMATQVAHFGQLIALISASTDESTGIVLSFQLCERAHGYPCIAQALIQVTRLLADAHAMLPSTLTMLAEQRGYATSALWVGVLVERYACIPESARRFLTTEYVPKLGSPYCEFEDVEQGHLLALKLSQLELGRFMLGETKPFVALASAVRQQYGVTALETMRNCASAAALTPSPIGTFISKITELSVLRSMALPVEWSRFVNDRNRPMRMAAPHKRRSAGKKEGLQHVS